MKFVRKVEAGEQAATRQRVLAAGAKQKAGGCLRDTTT